jgi:hypothetical protein
MVGERRSRWHISGWALNLCLRAVIVAFAVEAALAGDDPRFEGKGIAVRDLVVAATALTLTFPVIHLARRRPARVYPLRADCLFLSILAVDMAANSLNLYEQPWRFDLIPHLYGPLAGYLALRALGMSILPAALLVNAGHVALELQEALGDAVFGTHNVHGAWDTATDLVAGLIGSVVIPFAWRRFHRLGARTGHQGPHGAYSEAWQIARPRTPSSSTHPPQPS